MDRCGQCGKEFPPDYCEVPRKPCPECGSTVRSFNRECQDGGCVSDSVSWKQMRPGVQSTAQLSDHGDITLTATGPSPKNEEDTLEICARLVRALNAAGGVWAPPKPPRKGEEQGIDAYSTNAAGEPLQMQVTRSSNNEKMWQEVNNAGSTTVAYDATSAARELIGAVRKKATKYSAAQKRKMTLVLDAGRTPSHTFQNVFSAFRLEHLQECQKAGFAQVWAVGGNDSLVVMLDV